MTPFVLDTSVAAAFVFKDEATVETIELLGGIGNSSVFVPSLFWHEARNLLINGARRGRMAKASILPAMAFIRKLPIEDCGSGADEDILNLANKHDLTAYDAAYLSLAIEKSCALITFDKKLRRAADIEGRAAPSLLT